MTPTRLVSHSKFGADLHRLAHGSGAPQQLGLRDIEPEHTRKPTIAFVGNSFVWGYDSEEASASPICARQDAGQSPRQSRRERLRHRQEYLMLKRLWARFTPAIVVLMVCVDNDRKRTRPTCATTGRTSPISISPPGAFDGQPVSWSRHLYFGHYWLARHSLGFFASQSRRMSIGNIRHSRLADPTERLIDMMRDMVTSKGGRLLVRIARDPTRVKKRIFNARENFACGIRRRRDLSDARQSLDTEGQCFRRGTNEAISQ